MAGSQTQTRFLKTANSFQKDPRGSRAQFMRTWELYHGCPAYKSTAAVWWYHVNMDPNHCGIDSTRLWKPSSKIKPIEKPKADQPGTSMGVT